MMKFNFALLALAILLASAFVFAGYREQMEVRVLNSRNQVIPGADVSVTYEISESRGEFTTQNKTTNERGRVSFDFSNSEYVQNDTNLKYTVNAYFMGLENHTEFIYGIGEYPRAVKLSAFMLYITTLDKDSSPISVQVKVGEQSRQSDELGRAYFMVTPGRHTITTDYKGYERKQDVVINNDTIMNILIKVYNLTVKVVDDAGKPIQADIYIGAQQKTSDAQGYAQFSDVQEEKPQVSVYYGRFKKAAYPNLDAQTDILIFFDSHAPDIRNIEAEWKDKFLQVRAIVDDNGTYASGMGERNASVKLVYSSVEGVEKEVPMYGIGYNYYEGLIPVAGTEAQIKYTILAYDADGNRKSSSDAFVLPTNRDVPGKGEKTEPPKLGENLAPLQNNTNTLFMIGVGIVLIIGGIGIYYYRDRIPGLGGGLEPPMPPSPPTAPKN